MNPIRAYLKDDTLLEDKRQAKKIKMRSFMYYLKNGRLYKRSLSMPLVMCLIKDKGIYVLREFHEGICSSHAVTMSLALKALRNGYF